MVAIRQIVRIASLQTLRKAVRSIIRKWRLEKASSNSIEDQNASFRQFKLSHQEVEGEGETMNGVHSYMYNNEHHHKSIPSSLPINASRRSKAPAPSPLCRSMSRRSRTGATESTSSAAGKSTESNNNNLPFRSTCSSTQGSSTHIMFSNSSGMLKDPPIERNLECTLKELCYGCKKKIKITRDVITEAGQIVQEEEVLTIKVKPGWKKGTKITFEGMGNERSGSYPADITFIIAEKRHQLFRREGDDLELAIEIPLLQALTGHTIPVPLLGGDSMNLTINDIIYPGYEKIIPGQGMPKSKELGTRGNLHITFLVHFPSDLTDEQRADARSILEEGSANYNNDE